MIGPANVPTFGEAVPGREYVARPGAYGLFVDDAGRLLVARDRVTGELFLPGGGLEPGEDDLTALHRELAEELALTIATVGRCVARATEYFTGPRNWRKEMAFYPITLGPTLPDVVPEHEALWLPVDEAAMRLEPFAHRWVVPHVVGGVTL